MDELAALVEQVPDEVLDYIEELETRVEKAESALAEVPEPEDNTDGDPIAKALADLPEEISKAFKDQQERLAEAEKALAAERVAKADAEWTEKARSFDGLVDDPAEFGKELREIADSNPELAESIVTKLQAASNRISKSALFVEKGHAVPAVGSAEEKIQNIAKASVEADPSKSMEVATAEAWEANPDLYDQYQEERRSALKA